MDVIDHPMRMAQGIAYLLESDPIAVAQVKETISVARLIELFDITRDDLPYESKSTVQDILDENDMSADDLLEYVVEHFTKAEILEELGK